MNVLLIFARKRDSLTLSDHLYTAEVYSFTKPETNKLSISDEFVHSKDVILLFDDFLANGQAALWLVDMIEQSGAELAGLGTVIEKGFQSGGELLRERNIRLESLANIQSIQDGKILFAEKDK